MSEIKTKPRLGADTPMAGMSNQAANDIRLRDITFELKRGNIALKDSVREKES